jgi:hypothetical protein
MRVRAGLVDVKAMILSESGIYFYRKFQMSIGQNGRPPCRPRDPSVSDAGCAHSCSDSRSLALLNRPLPTGGGNGRSVDLDTGVDHGHQQFKQQSTDGNDGFGAGNYFRIMHEQRALTHGSDIYAVGSCGGSTAQDIGSFWPRQHLGKQDGRAGRVAFAAAGNTTIRESVDLKQSTALIRCG